MSRAAEQSRALALNKLAETEISTLMQQNSLTQAHLAMVFNDQNLTMFEQLKALYAANRLGLDLMTGEVYAIKRAGKMMIQVGIQGYRINANRSDDYRGQVGPEWCGKDGVWKEKWTEPGLPVACRVGVRREGHDIYWGVAHMDEYNENQSVWRTKPRHMLAKVAEAQAIRRAYPATLAGTYIPEEFGQTAEPDQRPPEAYRPFGADVMEADYVELSAEEVAARDKARARLIGLFGSRQACEEWLGKLKRPPVDDLTTDQLLSACAAVEKARAQKAQATPTPAASSQTPAPAPAPLAPMPDEAPAKKPRADKSPLAQLKTRVNLRYQELFGKDVKGKDAFYRWCDRYELLAVNQEEQRPSIAASNMEELQACLDALSGMTGESVAEFARELEAEAAREEAAARNAFPETVDPWDEADAEAEESHDA